MGRPDLTAPAPRIKGKVDLSGVGRQSPLRRASLRGADLVKVQVDLSDITKHVINVFWGIKPEDEPLRPEGASILKERERAPTDRH